MNKMDNARMRVAVVFGTRPETIKLAPVIAVLGSDQRFAVHVIATGQHREMVREIIAPLGIRADIDLDLMRPSQTLTSLVASALVQLDAAYAEICPDMVIVQGDTSTAFAAALAAFHRKIPVAHVEAGLRTHDKHNPYPEESNRRMVAAVADMHFAPTSRAAANLFSEGIAQSSVFTTGNTVIDALGLALRQQTLLGDLAHHNDNVILVTLHRREAWDAQTENGENILASILRGIRAAAADHSQYLFVYPVHRNPRVKQLANDVLGEVDNVRLIEPLPYFEFVHVLSRSRLVVTDSGGIQEEAPSLGVPVCVLRKTTERPEALGSGWNTLVGVDSDEIRSAISTELGKARSRPAILPCPSPFGDGRASERIRDALLWFRGGQPFRPADFSDAEVPSGVTS